MIAVAERRVAAIHQPQYLPWLGYFDKLLAADVFVYLDDVQYVKNEWKNRKLGMAAVKMIRIMVI